MWWFRLGLIEAGHEIVYASDFDKDCVTTYRKNIGNHIHHEDVHDIDCKKLPEYDLLTAGFPCQGFSVANLFRHVDDKRNKLYVQIVRILTEARPKYFLAENVPGILNLQKGEVAKVILKEFSNIGEELGHCGYDVNLYILNALNYGVPQNRKRVIFLGISRDIEPERRAKYFENFPPPETHGENNEQLERPLDLKYAIYDLPDIDTEAGKAYLNHYGTKHKVKINGYIGNRKLSWGRRRPTMVGRGGGTGGPVIAVHPNLKRRFSVRETARIQTFPDDFEFFGPVSSQYRQIGNAVAVNFAKHLGIFFKDFEDNKLAIKKRLKQINLVFS